MTYTAWKPEFETRNFLLKQTTPLSFKANHWFAALVLENIHELLASSFTLKEQTDGNVFAGILRANKARSPAWPGLHGRGSTALNRTTGSRESSKSRVSTCLQRSITRQAQICRRSNLAPQSLHPLLLWWAAPRARLITPPQAFFL